MTKRCFNSLLEQLRSSPDKALAVRHLRFSRPVELPRQQWLSDDLSDALSCLPNVEHLSMQNFRLRASIPGSSPAHSFDFSSINVSSLTWISLHDMLFDSDLDLWAMICAFPRLNMLTMYSVHCYSYTEQPAMQAAQPYLKAPLLCTLDVEWIDNRLASHVFTDDAMRGLEDIAFEQSSPWWQLFRDGEVYPNLRRITCHAFAGGKHSSSCSNAS